MLMHGQKQNKNTNRSQSLSQMSILVTLGYNDSDWSQQCPKRELHCVTASHSEDLIPSLLLCVRQIRVSISGRLCACWLNPKWQPLQGPNGGEKSDSQKFSTALSDPKVTQMHLLFFASFSLLVMDLSSQVFTENLASIGLRCFFFFRNNEGH